MTTSTVHFAYIAALPTAEAAVYIVNFTAAELAAYAAYLDNTAFTYIDDVPADYIAPTAASVLAAAEAALHEAELDTLTAAINPSTPDPLPADFD